MIVRINMISISLEMKILNSGKVLQVRQNVANGIVISLLNTILIDFAVAQMVSRRLELAKN